MEPYRVALKVGDYLPAELLAIPELAFRGLKAELDFVERYLNRKEVKRLKREGEAFLEFKERCIEEDLSKLFSQVLERYRPYLASGMRKAFWQAVETPYTFTDFAQGDQKEIRYRLETKRGLAVSFWEKVEEKGESKYSAIWLLEIKEVNVSHNRHIL